MSEEKDTNRKPLYVHVDDATKELINKGRKVEDCSQGVFIDRAVSAYKPKKPEEKK